MKLTVYRRLSQISFILFIFLVPVLNLFRYDTATHELIFFGKVWGLGLPQGFYADHSSLGAFHIAAQFFFRGILPWLLFLALFPLVGLFTGRLFCGWLCTEGALFELADFLTLRLMGSRSLWSKKPSDPTVPRLSFVIIALVSVTLIPLLGGAALTGYLVAPKTVWQQIVHWQFTSGVRAGIIGVAVYILVTSILVRHVLCRFVCAAGLMQMLFGWISPFSLRLNMDAARIHDCTDCRGCDRACFMNVTPRKNKRDISCVNCGACVETCDRELGRGRGLFRLAFGTGDGQQSNRHEEIDAPVNSPSRSL